MHSQFSRSPQEEKEISAWKFHSRLAILFVPILSLALVKYSAWALSAALVVMAVWLLVRLGIFAEESTHHDER